MSCWQAQNDDLWLTVTLYPRMLVECVIRKYFPNTKSPHIVAANQFLRGEVVATGGIDWESNPSYQHIVKRVADLVEIMSWTRKASYCYASASELSKIRDIISTAAVRFGNPPNYCPFSGKTFRVSPIVITNPLSMAPIDACMKKVDPTFLSSIARSIHNRKDATLQCEVSLHTEWWEGEFASGPIDDDSRMMVQLAAPMRQIRQSQVQANCWLDVNTKLDEWSEFDNAIGNAVSHATTNNVVGSACGEVRPSTCGVISLSEVIPVVDRLTPGDKAKLVVRLISSATFK